MKIASWNVWNRSRNLEAFEHFVRDQRADIFAFQELTDAHIDILRSMEDYRLFLAEDFIEDGQLTHLGLFTRYDADNHRILTHNQDRHFSPSWIGRRNRWVECLQSQSLSVTVEGHAVTVINVHLTCGASPRRRRAELESETEAGGEAERLIVVGDMNSFAKPWLNPIVGWFYGFGVSDMALNEIRSLDAFSVARGMVRAPARAVTFPGLRLHLDHLFVRGLNIVTAEAGRSTFGSDHRPVIAALAR